MPDIAKIIEDVRGVIDDERRAIDLKVSNPYENALAEAALCAMRHAAFQCREHAPALIAEIERLQDIVARLPHTADGVPIAPGTEVWIAWQDCGVERHVVTRIGNGLNLYPIGWDDLEPDCTDHVGRREMDIVFSTEIAALAYAASLTPKASET